MLKIPFCIALEEHEVYVESYDGAETCELVGWYLLSQLKQIPGIKIGLYRDDGLAVLNQIPKQIEKAKKQICRYLRTTT